MHLDLNYHQDLADVQMLQAWCAANPISHWKKHAEEVLHAPRGSLDIQSITPGLVGAETFAAVSISSNSKLKGDMAKLLKRDEQNLYEFFTVPKYP